MQRPILATLIALVVAVPILVLDPIGLLGPSFEFEDHEMRAAIEGTWSLRVTRIADDSTRTFTLSIRQAGTADQVGSRGLVPSAAACGNRTLVRSAAACIELSTMPLEVAALEQRDAPSITGRFMVDGTTFDHGELELRFGDDPEAPMSFAYATITPTGEVTRVSVGQGYRATLKRTAAAPSTATSPR